MIDINVCRDKTDEELVALTLKDQEYFLCLINKYKNKLFNYIRRITNVGVEDAEDILQEVFIKTYQNLNDFDSDLKFSSWIFRITHNHVISFYRKSKARPQNNAISLDTDIVHSIASEYDLEKDVDSNILKEKIEKTLKKMNNRYKELMILKYMEEKSYKEISDIMKKPTGTIASAMNKAKKIFKQEFEKI